jgi:small subunit ribosomal protein S18
MTERDPSQETAGEPIAESPPSTAPAAAAPAQPAAPAPAEPTDGDSTATVAATAPAEGAVERPAAPSDGPSERGEGERFERGDDRRPERRRRHFGRRKVCAFCIEKATSIDYKDPAKLRRYLSDRGRIESRRKTGTCAKHQRWLATALKRARHLALLPYTPEHIRVSGTFATRRSG